MSTVEEIKQKVDIVGLVGEYVPLKSSGRNFKAACPFHTERTPSFYVFPERQTWHCFGACATGGDIFSFVMRREGVEFGEALRTLAARAGVALEAPRAAQDKVAREERLQRVNRAAAISFHDALLSSSEAAAARAYLEKRGLTPQTVEEFRLGYSPQDPGALERRLRAQEFTERDMLAAGLVRRRDDGSTYPFFRGRLMIPIQDSRGDYVGFGARALDDSTPKYINSPQSDLFDKGSLLYGLHRAMEAIKEGGQAVIVEGYMDVLTAHQHGFRNVVASMGTALTERQVGALKRLASVFVLALDPDAAGDEGTLRSLESSWRILDRATAPAPPRRGGAPLTGPDSTLELVLGVMDLPKGRDPDEVIKEDPANWERLVATATPVIDYVFAAVARRFDTTTARGKAAVAQRLAPFIHNAGNIFEQNERIRTLARMLKEEENIIRDAVRRFRTPGVGRAERVPQWSRPSPGPVRDPLEVYCLAMLLRFPELRERTSSLSLEHFCTASTQEIFRRLSEGAPPERLKERLDVHLHGEVDYLLEYPLPPAGYREREQGLEQCLRRLEERRLKLRAEAVGEDAELAEEVSSGLAHIYGQR